MFSFHSVVTQLMGEFDDVMVSYMPRECNFRADDMYNVGSGSKPAIDLEGNLISLEKGH